MSELVLAGVTLIGISFGLAVACALADVAIRRIYNALRRMILGD